MKTVNRESLPKADCWAYENVECQILTETCCERGRKCGHYKNWAQHLESKRKAHKCYKKIGIKK